MLLWIPRLADVQTHAHSIPTQERLSETSIVLQCRQCKCNPLQSSSTPFPGFRRWRLTLPPPWLISNGTGQTAEHIRRKVAATCTKGLLPTSRYPMRSSRLDFPARVQSITRTIMSRFGTRLVESKGWKPNSYPRNQCGRWAAVGGRPSVRHAPKSTEFSFFLFLLLPRDEDSRIVYRHTHARW